MLPKGLQLWVALIIFDLGRRSGWWKSSGSISIGNAVLHAEDALEQFGTSIEFAKDVLGSENLVDLDDLDGARGTLNELSEKKDALSDFKRKNPGFEHYKVRTTFLFSLSFWPVKSRFVGCLVFEIDEKPHQRYGCYCRELEPRPIE